MRVTLALAVTGLLVLAAQAHKLHEGVGDDDRSGHQAGKALDGALFPAGLSGSGCLRSPPVASHAAASSMSHAEGLPRALLAPGRGQELLVLESAGGSSRDKGSRRRDSHEHASVSHGSSSKDRNRDTVSDHKRSSDSLFDKKEVKEVARKDHADEKVVFPQHTLDKKDHSGCDKANDPSCGWPIKVFRRRDRDRFGDFDDQDIYGVQLRTVGKDKEDKDHIKHKDRSKERDDECGCLKDTWIKLTIDGRVQCPCCISWRPSDGKERCPCPEYH